MIVEHVISVFLLGVVSLLLSWMLVGRAANTSGYDNILQVRSRHGVAKGGAAAFVAFLLLLGSNVLTWHSFTAIAILDAALLVSVLALVLLVVVVAVLFLAPGDARVDTRLSLDSQSQRIRQVTGSYHVRLAGAAAAYFLIFVVGSGVLLSFSTADRPETQYDVCGMWETSIVRAGDEGKKHLGSTEIHQLPGRSTCRFMGNVENALAINPDEPQRLSWATTEASIDEKGVLTFRYRNARNETGTAWGIADTHMPDTITIRYRDDPGTDVDGSEAGYIEFTRQGPLPSRTRKEIERIVQALSDFLGFGMSEDELAYPAVPSDE